MIDNRFRWVDFYMELAGKLVPFKDNRDSLVEKIKIIFQKIGINLPKLEEGGNVIDANADMTDLNGHNWKFMYFSFSTNTIVTNAPVIELPEYDPDSGVDEATYGAINMINAVYEQQGMSAPVDETCVFNH